MICRNFNNRLIRIISKIILYSILILNSNTVMSNQIEKNMKAFGLVNITDLETSIQTDIRYATPNNFVGEIIYKEPFGVYAEPRLAQAIANAQRKLSKIHPGYSIVIFDAARPLSAQKTMFKIVENTEKEKYVANPFNEIKGGFHNYGMAVDLSIANEKGELLDMGTDFDSFSEESHVGNERQMVIEGKISMQAYINRMLLYMIMGEQGLLPYPYEWWHYQLDQEEESKENFNILDF